MIEITLIMHTDTATARRKTAFATSASAALPPHRNPRLPITSPLGRSGRRRRCRHATSRQRRHRHARFRILHRIFSRTRGERGGGGGGRAGGKRANEEGVECDVEPEGDGNKRDHEDGGSGHSGGSGLTRENRAQASRPHTPQLMESA